MVYAAQFRISISQFDGILDSSLFVMKLEVPDSDFLGAYIIVSCGRKKVWGRDHCVGMHETAHTCLPARCERGELLPRPEMSVLSVTPV